MGVWQHGPLPAGRGHPSASWGARPEALAGRSAPAAVHTAETAEQADAVGRAEDKRRPRLLGTQMNVSICRNRMKPYLFTQQWSRPRSHVITIPQFTYMTNLLRRYRWAAAENLSSVRKLKSTAMRRAHRISLAFPCDSL